MALLILSPYRPESIGASPAGAGPVAGNTPKCALQLERIDAEGARFPLSRVADLDGERLGDTLFAVAGRAGQDAREDGLGHVGASILPLAVQQVITPAIEDLQVPVGARRVHRARQRFDSMQCAAQERPAGTPIEPVPELTLRACLPGMPDIPDYAAPIEHKPRAYAANGVPALVIYPQGFRDPPWPCRVFERIETIARSVPLRTEYVGTMRVERSGSPG